MHQGPFRTLVTRLENGEVSRRQFLAQAATLGVSMGTAMFMANSVAAGGASSLKNGFAMYPRLQGTPEGSPDGVVGDTRPAVGMEGKTRGQDGELKIIQWQAMTALFRHKSGGYKDVVAADMVNEPLMRNLADGSLVPNLITEVPSVENGMLEPDFSALTFKLQEGVLWSDGTPFTANDVVFTWQWITNPDNGANTIDTWSPVSAMEAVDETTVRVTFGNPSPAWFDPFTGHRGHIIPAHYWENDPAHPDAAALNDAFMLGPIGTGPFVVEKFDVNDQATFIANENYRDPNKPAFSNILIKGGGDPAAAGRAVLQTGDFHFGWNVQIEPALVDELVNDDSAGFLVADPGTNVERLTIQHADPHTEVDGQRAQKDTPNPVMGDKAVRQAMNLCIPRQLIAEEFYGLNQPPTANILDGLDSFSSKNTSWEFDPEKAATILEEAGWVLDGDYRVKDGVKCRVVLGTTVNAVRQKCQAVIQQACKTAGIEVQLDQVDAGIFFDGSAGNDQNLTHHYWDMAMWATNATSILPITYLEGWVAGENGENMPQKENNFVGQNISRYNNPDYDAAFATFNQMASIDEAFELLIQLNDILIEDVAVIPMIIRAGDTYGISRKLVAENIAIGAGFELTYWNIANWNLA